MLGLADQVGGDERRVGGVVGEDRDLGRAGLGVDADHAPQQPLGRDDVDVAGTGDQVDRTARARRRGRTSRSPARRRRRTPRRRRAARTRPGWSARAVRSWFFCGGLASAIERTPATCAGTTFITTLLDQRREPAGDVEPDAVDRHLAVGHRRAGCDLARHVVLELGLAGGAQASYRLLERRAHGGVELGERGLERPARHGDVVAVHPVETGRQLDDRLDAAGPDGVDDRLHLMRRGLDVELGARHARAVVDGRRVGAPQVDAADHGHVSSLGSPAGRSRVAGAPWTRVVR